MSGTCRRTWVRGVAKQLHEGEDVTVRAADTERNLTVTEEARYVEREPYRCNGLLVTLEGYGTTYTLEVPETEKPAKLLYPSSSALGEIVTDIDRNAEEQFAIVAENTAADLGIPER